MNCEREAEAFVCGSDDVTYRNRCQLDQARECQGQAELAVAHLGGCDEGTSCGRLIGRYRGDLARIS